ncbi:putative glycerol-3-phosphate dehydrogenase [Plasmodium gaboni]|uniref:Glycerol-3-phosphate dehydrogenase [NAD(+)] n=1 Tax=Plasmodium gaboni TaxID=647221 RepID=A0A151LIR2_9APIC|nr:putative glycerol-3-phosphate dehydrogenase [Plasmodium gaboni]KYN98786.1 putative glycerol-3-phosphate dehydrogenase [Plasmodium gaboni]SOV23225.1 glycerol-3-phosphate dehydrogenase, putative [Plasmodium sp. DRC-Itaito]
MLKFSILYFYLIFQVITCFSVNQINVGNKYSLIGNPQNNVPLKVSIIGSGNWGTVVSKIIGINAQKLKIFHPIVKMYVKEEIVEEEKLSDIINKKKENIKYMKGMKIPENILAISNLKEVIDDADLLIFVLPHQYLDNVLDEILQNNNLKKNARAISLIKGIKMIKSKPQLLSDMIEKKLDIECLALSGSNIAEELSREHFSESTIGFEKKGNEVIWQNLFDRTYFKVNCIQDKPGVEICGALKNVIALGVGFIDGLTASYNTKSAIIRIGLEEMKKFAKMFFPKVLDETFLDSCGLADLITTCLGGRNFKCAKEFAKRKGKDSWELIEAELLNGQKLQGTDTTKEVYDVLEYHQLKNEFPLICTIYEISFQKKNPCSIIDVLSTKKLRNIKYK